MKRKIFLFIFLIALLLSSCKEPVNTTSLNLKLISNASKTILPNTPVVISYYIIEGNGPKNHTFSIRSTKNSLRVEGLSLGEWTIKATAFNAKDVPLVKGSTMCNLQKNSYQADVFLDTLIGKGNFKLKMTWPSNLRVGKPLLELSLVKENTKENIISNSNTIIDYDKATANIDIKDLDSGSYNISAKLLSAHKNILSGFARAIRIVNNHTTGSKTTIHLRVDDIVDTSTIGIGTNMEEPIQGDIIGVPNKVGLGTSLTAKFLKDDNPEPNISLAWYLNGELKSSDLEYTFSPRTGNHRLDVIVSKKGFIGAQGSASITFSVQPVFDGNKPVVIEELSLNDKNLNLNEVNDVEFLNDRNFVFTTANSSDLTLCTISQDQIQKLDVLSDPILNKNQELTAEKDTIVTTKDKVLTIFQVNPSTYKLKKLMHFAEYDDYFPEMEHNDARNHSIYYKPYLTKDAEFLVFGADKFVRHINLAERTPTNDYKFRKVGVIFNVSNFSHQQYAKSIDMMPSPFPHKDPSFLILLNSTYPGFHYLSSMSLQLGYIPPKNMYHMNFQPYYQIKKNHPKDLGLAKAVKILDSHHSIYIEDSVIGILESDYVYAPYFSVKGINYCTITSKLDNKSPNSSNIVSIKTMDLNKKKNLVALAVYSGVQFIDINSDYTQVSASFFLNLGIGDITKVVFSRDSKYAVAISEKAHKMFLIKLPD